MTASPGSEDAGLVLSAEDRETLRLWLCEHNGSMGPGPVTAGAGGLGGLWKTCAQIVQAARAQERAALGTPPGECRCGADGMPTTHPCGATCEHA